MGTLFGPLLGVVLIKYFENIFSSFNDQLLTETFGFLPEIFVKPIVSVIGVFVGDGWHLTLGALFMIIVIFLPGGIIEGIGRIQKMLKNRKEAQISSRSAQTQESL